MFHHRSKSKQAGGGRRHTQCLVKTSAGVRQTWVWLAMRLRRWMLASDILSRSSATGLLGTLPCTSSFLGLGLVQFITSCLPIAIMLTAALIEQGIFRHSLRTAKTAEDTVGLVSFCCADYTSLCDSSDCSPVMYAESTPGMAACWRPLE